MQQPNIRHHSFSLKGINPKVTPEGFYVFENVKVAKIGMFPWRVSELEQDGILNVLTDLDRSETVYLQRDSISQEAIDSLKGKFLTNDHPSSGLVTPRNAKDQMVGTLGSGLMDGEWLVLDQIVVGDQQSIIDLQSGKVELSIGYTYETPVDWVEGLPYVAKEVIIYINHVAIVARGRAGPECRFNKQDLEMDNEKLDKISNAIEQMKVISGTLSSRLNALEIKSKSEAVNGTILSSASEEIPSEENGKGTEIAEGVSKNDISGEQVQKPGSSVECGSGIGKNESPEGVSGKGDPKENPTEEEGSEENSERANTGETVMAEKLNIEVVEEFARKNDLFILNAGDMNALLKQVNTNGLIGLKGGKEFTSKDKTRINMQSFVELVDAELAVRKVQDEADKLNGRNNDAPETASLSDFLGI